MTQSPKTWTEYIPFDAVFHDQSVSLSFYHNEYAQRWADTVRAAISEVGMDDEVVPFHRSASLLSPRSGLLLAVHLGVTVVTTACFGGSARSFWLGDQLVSWDRHDGLQSVLYGVFTRLVSRWMLHTEWAMVQCGGLKGCSAPI